MQELTKPTILSELPQDILDQRNLPLQLIKFQEEYKERLGLSGNNQNNLPYHPRALEIELLDIKEHFENLERNRFNLQWQEKFLQYMFQEPPLKVTRQDLEEQECINKVLGGKLQETKMEMETSKKNVMKETGDIEVAESKSLSEADIADKTLEEMMDMENELMRIELILTKKSDLTVDKAKDILAKQTQAMTECDKAIDEKTDTLEELQWKVEDLEDEVNKLETITADKIAKADKAVRLNEERDKNVEEEYFVYQEMTKMCTKLMGVASIDFESSTLVHITYAEPFHTILSIHLDVEKNKVINATLTGSKVEIKDLLKIAIETNSMDGIKMLFMEVLSRLKNTIATKAAIMRKNLVI